MTDKEYVTIEDCKREMKNIETIISIIREDTQSTKEGIVELRKNMCEIKTALKARNEKDAELRGITIGKRLAEEAQALKEKEKETTVEKKRKSAIFWLSIIGGALLILQAVGVTMTFKKASVVGDTSATLEEIQTAIDRISNVVNNK